MSFKDPWILLLIPLALAAYYFLFVRQKPPSIHFSRVALFETTRTTWKIKFRHIPAVLRAIVLALFVFALAGPQKVLEETIVKSEGIDIVLAIDASGSMAAEDFTLNGKRVNRLAIVKDVVRDFIDERRADRIGLIAFAGLAYTVCPLTTDYSWLQENLDRLELGIIDDRATAVGSAIASSLTRLRNSEAKSKIIILLTDGVSNAGKITPVAAARAAEALGIKIYTIGAGTKGRVPFPTTDFFGRRIYQNVVIDLDEETLKEVASMTGGSYFRATDTQSLRRVYEEIDRLEKTEIEEFGYREFEPLFGPFLMFALIVLIFELILTNTIMLKIP